MKTKSYLALVLGIITLAAQFIVAQKPRQNAAAKPPQPGLLAALPLSDAVAIVKVKRLLNEGLPKLLATNPAKLNQINAEIDGFKTRTGIDPRAFDELALGLRYSYPAEGITKISTVALASGSFNPGALVAAGRIAADGKYKEEKYQGKTIHIFSLDQHIKLLGMADIRLSDLAVTVLNNQTLALGELQAVRSAIDVGKKAAPGNAELIQLATKDPNAVIGFGGNLSPTLLRNLSIANDAIARDLTAVRQAYGSVGLTEKDLQMFIAARTVDEYAARNLGNTLEALKQFGGLFVNRLSAAKSALAKTALANLRITNQGNELQIRTAVSQADVAPLMAGF